MMVRKVDELGRIVLPAEIRQSMDINVRDALEIFTDEGRIILQKYAEEDTYLTPNDFTCIYFSLIMVFAYVAVLAILRKSLNQRVASFGLVCVLIVELFLSGLWGLNDLGADVGYSVLYVLVRFFEENNPANPSPGKIRRMI